VPHRKIIRFFLVRPTEMVPEASVICNQLERLIPPPPKTNSVAWVRERTVQTDRPPLVGELSANFCG
jgi:hypothetical protein